VPPKTNQKKHLKPCAQQKTRSACTLRVSQSA